jgi:hypothetical protein
MNDRQRLEAIVGVVCRYLPPDGIPVSEAMSQIIALVDPLPSPVQEPVAQNNCIKCSNADSWGLPDKPFCRSCVSNSEWKPLNASSKNPATPPAAQPAPANGEVAFTFAADMSNANYSVCATAKQKPWVGLTRMELIKCGVLPFGMSHELARAIEAKLKEKNNDQ